MVQNQEPIYKLLYIILNLPTHDLNVPVYDVFGGEITFDILVW